MNQLLELLLRRRSVRKYTEDPVSREQLERIVQAGLLSHTGKNKREWQFVAVTDRATLGKLSEARAGGAAKMLAGAPAAVLVFVDTDESDVWCEDGSIALSNMHLMATELGLGSCWIQGRLREAPDGGTTGAAARKILGVPGHYELTGILSVGVAAVEPAARTLEDADMSKVHWDRF